MPTYNIGLRQINIGTVAVTNGSATVTGTSIGAAWQTTAGGQTFPAFGAGDWIKVGTNAPVMIASGDSASQLTLQNNWAGGTASGQSYTIFVVTGVDSSVVAELLDSFLNLGLQANPFINALIANGSRMLRIEVSGTDILFKIGAQTATPPSNGDISGMVTVMKIDSTGKVTFPLGAPDLTKRNIFYNGSLQVFQRVPTSLTAAGFFHDRWYFTPTATATLTSTTMTGATVAPFFQRAACFTMGGAGSANAKYCQGFESNDYFALRGQRVTMSAWVRMQTAFSGNLQLFCETNTTVNSVQEATGTWTNQAPVTLPNANVSTNPINGLIQPTTTWTRVSATFDVPTTASLGIRFGLKAEGLQASGNIWYATGFKLEYGSVASEWVPEDAQVELARCMRYYQKSYVAATKPGTIATTGQVTVKGHGSANASFAVVRYPVPMRSTPTLTFYNPGSTDIAGTATAWNDSTTTTNQHAGAIEAGQSENGFTFRATAAHAVALSLNFHYTADKELD